FQIVFLLEQQRQGDRHTRLGNGCWRSRHRRSPTCRFQCKLVHIWIARRTGQTSRKHIARRINHERNLNKSHRIPRFALQETHIARHMGLEFRCPFGGTDTGGCRVFASAIGCGSRAVVSIHSRCSGLTGFGRFFSLLWLGLFGLGLLRLFRLWLLDLFWFRLRLRLGFWFHFRLFDRQRNSNFGLFGLDHIGNHFFRFLNGLWFWRWFGRRYLSRFGRCRLLLLGFRLRGGFRLFLRRFSRFRLGFLGNLLFHRRFRLRRKFHHHGGNLRAVWLVFLLCHVDGIGTGGMNGQNKNARAEPAPRIMPEGMMVNVG